MRLLDRMFQRLNDMDIWTISANKDADFRGQGVEWFALRLVYLFIKFHTLYVSICSLLYAGHFFRLRLGWENATRSVYQILHFAEQTRFIDLSDSPFIAYTPGTNFTMRFTSIQLFHLLSLTDTRTLIKNIKENLFVNTFQVRLLTIQHPRIHFWTT